MVTCPIITVMVNGRQFVNRIKAIVLSNLTSLQVYNSLGWLVFGSSGISDCHATRCLCSFIVFKRDLFVYRGDSLTS